MRKDTYIEIYKIVQPLIESTRALHPEGTPLGDSEVLDIVIQVLNIYRRQDTDSFREGVESAIETLQSKAKLLEL